MKEGYLKKAEALRLKNQKGPGGVPFGGIGAGYFEINPDGKMSRTCHNNIHKQFIDFPEGMFLALYEKLQDGEPLALRLQKDDENICLMGAFSESDYLGFFPVADFSFKNPVCGRKTCVKHEVMVFSAVTPNGAKNSSLPAALWIRRCVLTRFIRNSFMSLTAKKTSSLRIIRLPRDRYLIWI